MLARPLNRIDSNSPFEVVNPIPRVGRAASLSPQQMRMRSKSKAAQTSVFSMDERISLLAAAVGEALEVESESSDRYVMSGPPSGCIM